jgi:hypothetical protein
MISAHNIAGIGNTGAIKPATIEAVAATTAENTKPGAMLFKKTSRRPRTIVVGLTGISSLTLIACSCRQEETAWELIALEGHEFLNQPT